MEIEHGGVKEDKGGQRSREKMKMDHIASRMNIRNELMKTREVIGSSRLPDHKKG